MMMFVNSEFDSLLKVDDWPKQKTHLEKDSKFQKKVQEDFIPKNDPNYQVNRCFLAMVLCHHVYIYIYRGLLGPCFLEYVQHMIS